MADDEIEVGDWVRHSPHVGRPAEQTVKVPMLVTEVDDAGITCTFEGGTPGEIYKFARSDVAKLDDAAESKARADKSKQTKAAAKEKEEAKKKAEEEAKPKPAAGAKK